VTTTPSMPARMRPRNGVLLLFLQMPLAAVVAGYVLNLVSLPVASFAVFVSSAAFPAWVSHRTAVSGDPGEAVHHLHRYAVRALGVVAVGTVALVAASAVTGIGSSGVWRGLGAELTGEPSGGSWALLAGVVVCTLVATCTLTSVQVVLGRAQLARLDGTADRATPRYRMMSATARTGFSALVAAALVAAGVASAPAARANHGESSTLLFQYVAGASSSVSTYGQSVHFAAQVSDSSFSCLSVLHDCDPPSGTVTFYYSVSPTESIAMGTATHQFFTTSDSWFEIDYCCLPAGQHEVFAIYWAQADGGGNHFGPSSGEGIHTVQKGAPVIQLHQNSGSTDLGQPVTFTASIMQMSVSAAPPTGTVQFSDNGVPLGGPIPLDGTRAVLTTSSLGAGSRTIRAQYSGDANHQSVGTQVTHAVRSPATSTILTSSPNPSTVGQEVLLRATVAAADGVTPTGTVSFYRTGGAFLGSAPLSSGTASLTVSSLPPGVHNLDAVYGGDATHTGSTSAAVTQTVNKHASTTVLTSGPNPSLVGQAVLLRATVTTLGDAPTGTVTFRDGATVLGTAQLSGGVATLSVSSLTAGAHSLAASYDGDIAHAPSTSAPVTQTVNRHASATALTSSANPSVPGQAVTFRAVVTTTGPGPITGTVTFKDGATTLGTAPITGGVATFTTVSLGVGTHTVTAHYSGDAAHTASASSGLSQSVVACTITVAGPGLSTAGTAGADVICGTAGPDDITGMAGNDVIVGFGGNDRLAGGDGNDTIHGGDGDDRLTGGPGDDRLTGDGGSDAAAGDAGTDTCSAEATAFCEVPARV
jgi:hypothetical protein